MHLYCAHSLARTDVCHRGDETKDASETTCQMLEFLEGMVVLGDYQTQSPARLWSSQDADPTFIRWIYQGLAGPYRHLQP